MDMSNMSFSALRARIFFPPPNLFVFQFFFFFQFSRQKFDATEEEEEVDDDDEAEAEGTDECGDDGDDGGEEPLVRREPGPGGGVLRRRA